MEEKKEILENGDAKSDIPVCESETVGAEGFGGLGCEEKIAELTDKYLRAAAELENIRRRAAIDADNAARASAARIAKDFLPLIDAIDAALSHAPDDVNFISLKKAADGVLEKTGIQKIGSIGRPLNPQFHNAVQAAESDAPAGVITAELQSGYLFGDSILRPAMVVVAK